jgi:hypothetical protein
LGIGTIFAKICFTESCGKDAIQPFLSCLIPSFMWLIHDLSLQAVRVLLGNIISWDK